MLNVTIKFKTYKNTKRNNIKSERCSFLETGTNQVKGTEKIVKKRSTRVLFWITVMEVRKTSSDLLIIEMNNINQI